MFDSPVTVLSSRLTEPLDWPETTIESTVFPVFSGKTGVDRIFDGHTQMLTNRPIRHA